MSLNNCFCSLRWALSGGITDSKDIVRLYTINTTQEEKAREKDRGRRVFVDRKRANERTKGGLRRGDREYNTLLLSCPWM